VGGNVLDLVAYLEGCSIREAARRLQVRCGSAAAIHINDPLVSKGREGSSGELLAPLPFSLRLHGHPYLRQRGVDLTTAARFGVGYYAGSGFLRHRIVFPIHDGQGRLVAYAGRRVDDSEPRYLFPPGFRKSLVIFNLHRAVSEARHAGSAIVVEGFFDCLRVHQSGYPNVVALLGTSLSGAQEKLLLDRFQKLVLLLDGDEAGRRASRQLAGRLRRKVSLSLAEAPGGRQPDQLSSEEIDRILCKAGGAAAG
jgi:DNA primase